jgi:hypothetical protein
VPAGETIFFGDLSALVLADDDRAAGSIPLSSPSARVLHSHPSVGRQSKRAESEWIASC